MLEEFKSLCHGISEVVEEHSDVAYVVGYTVACAAGMFIGWQIQKASNKDLARRIATAIRK